MQGFRSSWVNRPSRPVTEQSHHSFIDNVADLSHLVVAEGAKIPLKLAFGDIQESVAPTGRTIPYQARTTARCRNGRREELYHRTEDCIPL